MIRSDRGVLRLLRASRGRPLHIIDPFKVPRAEGVAKAKAVASAGFPALIVGSTDYENFDSHMTPYVAALKDVIDIPIILHFPPRRGSGIPMVTNADAVLMPALLGSESSYFAWQSYLETVNVLSMKGVAPPAFPEFIFEAALTFGDDGKSYDAMRTIPLPKNSEGMRRYTDVIELLDLDMIYLYSRHEGITPEVCSFFRRNTSPERLLFVGGGVRTSADVQRYLSAGADFVVFGGALEHAAWSAALPSIWPAARSAPHATTSA